MVPPNLLKALQELNRADKLYITQVLISELAQQESDLIQPGQSYPIWSPYDATEAAAAMLEFLQVHKDQNNVQA
jgi:hypothetical protein